MYERFTDRARKVMELANWEAIRCKDEYIGTEHILLGLVKEESGVAANVLKNLSLSLQMIRLEVEKIVQSGPDKITLGGKLPQTPRAKKVIEFAVEEARNLNHNYVGTEHLLLGLVREAEGVAAQVLMNLGLTLESVRNEVLTLLGHAAPAETASDPATDTVPLGEWCLDLTEAATQRRFAPVLGRQDEINLVLRVLSRRNRNSPLLVGEPGVGKRSIVRGVAERLAARQAPPPLDRCRIVALDLPMLVASSGEWVQAVNRVGKVLANLRRQGDTIIFLDRLASKGCARAAFAILLAIAGGEVRAIVTATAEEYRRVQKKDSRRLDGLRPILVAPAMPELTLEILRSLRPGYESHHSVQIGDDALVALVDICQRILPGRPCPGNAIDLLDESCAYFRQVTKPPPSELDAEIERLNNDKESAVAEKDFEKAAHLLNQANQLNEKKLAAENDWRQEWNVPEAIDAQIIERVAKELAGP